MSEPVPIEDVAENLSTNIVEWRRKCGCIKTSEKLRRILTKFPSPPPPSPLANLVASTVPDSKYQKSHVPTYCMYSAGTPYNYEIIEEKKLRSTCWQVISEVVQLVQLSVTATALALYYIIYCYMQLVYYTLRSALYFHHADVPMKITIGVVTMTSLIVGMNLLLRMERVIGLRY